MKSFKSLIRGAKPSSPTSENNNTPEESSPEDAAGDRSPLRQFAQSGFDLIDSSAKLEEEKFSWYSVKDFYPANIGELFKSGTYQVICKLGYGSASTTWLCRDRINHRYVTIKIYAAGQGQIAREVAALKHIGEVLSATAAPPVKHFGAKHVRTLLDQFELTRPKSSRKNLCLVFDPLGMSLADTRKMIFGGQMPIRLVKGMMFYMLQALDFLHRKAGMVHGDFQEDNIMMAISDPSDLKEVEEEELEDPSPRKVYKDHTIYATRLLELRPTLPVLCDFGEARFGDESYGEHAMPDLHRAPEILLRIEWNEKIDIWAFGLVLWTLVQGTNLFNDNEGGRWKSALPHMARTISLLGPPPKEFLDSTTAAKEFFDKDGKLKKGQTIEETSLEEELTAIEGERKTRFLAFLRRILQWDADKRPSALELLKDPWFKPGPEDESDDESDEEEDEEEEDEAEEPERR